MNGKDLVAQALEIGKKILAEVKNSNQDDAAAWSAELTKAVDGLEIVKDKATLRTKNGTNLAFPIKDAAENVAEAWEDAREGVGINEMTAMTQQFADSSEALVVGLRNRTVIMT
ncbi:MAG: hypothetical protein KKB20_01150 [Proteobacteria bacterium]|nr:hypothetical protein [Pseudomonadota bacterium]